MHGHAPVVGPVPGGCAALRAAHAASRLAAPLRPDGPRAAPRCAPHPRPGLRTGELDHPAPRRRDRSGPRALHAPSRPTARAPDAFALPRCGCPTRPLRIARRRDLPQRALSTIRSGGGVAGDRARAAPRRARRAARAASRPARDAPGPGPGAAFAPLGAERAAVARDVRRVREPHGAIALERPGAGRTARAADRGDAGRAGAAGGGGEAMRILHLSDPHVQLPRWRERPLRDFGPLRALATVELWKGRGRDYDGALATLRQIVRDADNLRADFAVCTGDLTQLAMEEEFALAQDALAPLGERLVCIPGNHDRYPLALEPNRLFEKYFPPRPLPDGFAALDSCGAVCWPVITQGRIVDAQLRQDFSGKIVLVHHAPFRSGGVPDWPWHRLRGAQKLLEAARGAAAILCGHIHERFQHR